MKVNFKKLQITAVNGLPLLNDTGKDVCIDVSKEVGNYIYMETSDLGELDLAQRIYKEGEVELTDEEIQIVGNYIRKGFKAVIQKAYNDVTGYGK